MPPPLGFEEHNILLWSFFLPMNVNVTVKQKERVGLDLMLLSPSWNWHVYKIIIMASVKGKKLEVEIRKSVKRSHTPYHHHHPSTKIVLQQNSYEKKAIQQGNPFGWTWWLVGCINNNIFFSRLLFPFYPPHLNDNYMCTTHSMRARVFFYGEALLSSNT